MNLSFILILFAIIVRVYLEIGVHVPWQLCNGHRAPVEPAFSLHLLVSSGFELTARLTWQAPLPI